MPPSRRGSSPAPLVFLAPRAHDWPRTVQWSACMWLCGPTNLAGSGASSRGPAASGRFCRCGPGWSRSYSSHSSLVRPARH
eukprot:10261000-Lingulodinium_polyedra.AAC.1